MSFGAGWLVLVEATNIRVSGCSREVIIYTIKICTYGCVRINELINTNFYYELLLTYVHTYASIYIHIMYLHIANMYITHLIHNFQNSNSFWCKVTAYLIIQYF